jgi:hypothetical protein
MQAEITLTQWNKFGDHPLVTKETTQEFPYQENLAEGCGFIQIWNTVRPGSYILEINGHFIKVLSEAQAKDVFNLA